MKQIKLTLIFLFLCSIRFSAFSQWQPTSGPYGGFGTCIEKIGNEIWLGTKQGIFVTTNEGVSWQRKPGFNYNITDIKIFNNQVYVVYQGFVGTPLSCVNYLKISSDNGLAWSNEILLPFGSYCTDAKLTKLNGAIFANSYSSSDNIISYNNGLNWINFETPFLQKYHQVFTDGNSIFCYGYNNNNTTSILYKSLDIGITWNFIDSASIIIGHYVQDSLVILSRSDSSQNSIIIRSTDLANTWDTIIISSTGLVDNIVSNREIIYAISGGDLFSSLDYGLTWNITTWESYIFSDNVEIASGDLIQSDFNLGATKYLFSQQTTVAANNGINAQYIYSLKSNNGVLFASTEENFYKSLDEGQSWQLAGCPIFGQTDFAFAADTIIGVTSDRGGASYITISYNNGISWDSVSQPEYTDVDYCTIGYNNGRIYLGATNLFYSDNFGQNWTQMPELPDSMELIQNFNSGKTGKVATHHNNLFVATNEGVIFKYEDSLQSWTFLHAFNSVGANNQNELYDLGNTLVMSGNRKFIVSYNDGATWVEPSLNGLPSRAIPHSLINKNGLWLATCYFYGVYASIDSGNNWSPFYVGNNPFVTGFRAGLAVVNNKLFAGTNYMSVWKYDGAIEIPTAIITIKKDDKTILAYPNPANETLFIETLNNEQPELNLQLYNELGILLKEDIIATNKYSINISNLPNGMYFLNITDRISKSETHFKIIHFR